MNSLGYKSVKYSVEIEVRKPTEFVFNHLVDLARWWPEDFKGQAVGNNSEFTFTTGDGHYSINRVIEFVPHRKLAWVTLKSLRKADNFDWSGTKFIFDLTAAGSSTHIKFTYDGVILEDESKKLVHICDLTLKEMFFNYVVHGKGK